MKVARIAVLGAFAALSVAMAIPAQANHSKAHAAIAALDPDKDGSLDIFEVKRGAIAKFNKLNPDRDFTLEAAEFKGVLSPKALAAANPDGDGTVSLIEYLIFVKRLFKAVNTDGDRTIEADELSATPKGRLLRRLIY